MTIRITKREAERLLLAVDAAGDDTDALRDALAPWVPREVLDGLELDGLFDLAAELNEHRTFRPG